MRKKNPAVTWHYQRTNVSPTTIPCFREAIADLYPPGGKVADLFARNSRLASPGLSNDIDPNTSADVHMDVFDFLDTIPAGSLDMVIIDPPWSKNQGRKLYHNKSIDLAWIPRIRRSAGTKLRAGGVMVCLGWDGCGAGDTSGFELERVIVCSHGGTRNATIMTVDRKRPLQGNVPDRQFPAGTRKI